MCSHCGYEWNPETEPTTNWLDALVDRRANALELMLAEKLAVPEEDDLLQWALKEQFERMHFNMKPLIVE